MANKDKNMFSSRKAILSFNFLAMIPRIIFLVIMLTACVVLIRLFVTNKFNTQDIQAEFLVNGFIYSAAGVNYYDPLTGRSYPTVIDLNQLDQQELDDSFHFPDNRLITAKISVSNEPGEKDVLKTIYYNKRWYDNWYPLLKLSLPGIGGVTDYKRTLPVIYRDEQGELVAGYVNYQVVQPKG
jgi:hypothetical protein